MKKIKFAFGIHNHQPIGNFDFVFEEAYQKSYLPFLEVLKKHPKIRMSIHFTGILLDWLEVNHPELLEMVREMTASGQLEVMSGAYYEPIISVIPEQDRKGQIQKLTKRVKELFGYDATGMWLAERIWEPALPSSLNAAGMQYTVIDDTHFKYAGLTDEELNGYFLSEDLGKTVALFPINKQLRYTIPFQEPSATLNVLKEMASEDGSNLIVFADDGEKFGVWPDTFHHVYENGWLESFFSLLEENMDWIEMVHFDEVLKQVKPKNKIYLPTASYAEMMHWSLFPGTFRQFEDFEHYLQDNNVFENYGLFVRGGFWRNFMTKYPEVNVMHKKMLRVSEKLWALPKETWAELKPAFDSLWASQCNCPYWHGVFGGLYLSHLRHAIFNNLILAEKLIDKAVKTNYPLIEVTDFDVDGYDEVLVETPVHNAYFKSNRGAAMFEYDFKPSAKNLLDTMSRREEGYHNKLKEAKLAGDQNSGDDGGTASIHDLVLAKEPGLLEYLNYDWYERKSFIDHFLDSSSGIDDFEKAKYKEQGDFVDQPYELIDYSRREDRVELVFERKGNVWVDGNFEPVRLRKTLSIENDSGLIAADYKIVNESGRKLNLKFAVEFNFGLQAGHADDRYYYNADGRLDDAYLDSKGILENTKTIGLKDDYLKINVLLDANRSGDIWRVPVETISLSEAGFERVYQSSSVLFTWQVELEKEWTVQLNHNVKTV